MAVFSIAIQSGQGTPFGRSTGRIVYGPNRLLAIFDQPGRIVYYIKFETRPYRLRDET